MNPAKARRQPNLAGLRWAIVPLAIAFASRALSTVFIVYASATGSSLNTTLTLWDGQWYLGIARSGYHALPVHPVLGQHDFAFFPLWPSAIRFANLGLLPIDWTAIVAANLLFLAAAIVVWRVVDQRFPASVATGAVTLLAFSPPAYVLSMAYPESLFLLLAGLSFLAASRIRSRALLTALAMLTHITGVAVVASALARVVTTTGRDRRGAALAVLAGAAAFAAWVAFIAVLTGNPTGLLEGSASWAHLSGIPAYLDAVWFPTARKDVWLLFFAIVIAGVLLARRRNVELTAYALAVVAICFLPGAVISSVPRYVLMAFPAFAGLADRLGRRGTLALTVLFIAGQWLFVSWSFATTGATSP